jgi:hypothetical protein
MREMCWEKSSPWANLDLGDWLRAMYSEMWSTTCCTCSALSGFSFLSRSEMSNTGTGMFTSTLFRSRPFLRPRKPERRKRRRKIQLKVDPQKIIKAL